MPRFSTIRRNRERELLLKLRKQLGALWTSARAKYLAGIVDRHST
uniref:Uncharacterized protein n=1 Tax=Setaria italica TaxID=4555 RepID=K3YP52_SETIT